MNSLLLLLQLLKRGEIMPNRYNDFQNQRSMLMKIGSSLTNLLSTQVLLYCLHRQCVSLLQKDNFSTRRLSVGWLVQEDNFLTSSYLVQKDNFSTRRLSVCRLVQEDNFLTSSYLVHKDNFSTIFIDVPGQLFGTE